MKHTAIITVALVAMFFLSQLIGIVVTNKYVDYEQTKITGNFSWKPLPSIAGMELERPKTAPQTSVMLILGALIVGTILVLLLLRFRQPVLWKLWFFLAVSTCLFISFSAFIPKAIAGILALIAAVFKAFRPNLIIHNLTELFVYGGLAVIFIPILNVFTAIILLILISVYDAYAVWKSKHMIKMAKFQTKSGIFAGLLVPYGVPKKIGKKGVAVRTAILGGGDIAFPLIFTGTVLQAFGPYKAIIVSVFVTIALALLLIFGHKKKFYPAMPFLTLGCLAGYLVVLLI